MRTLSNGKGQTLDTNLTDEQAVTQCQRLTSKFALELADKYVNYVRRKQAGRPAYPLSEAQTYWLHKLALDSVKPNNGQQVTSIGDMKGVIELFGTAKQHLKFPKIRLQVATALQNQRVMLSVAGPNSRNAGSINVTDGGRFGSNKYFGRVDLNGNFIKGRDCPDEIVELLRRFAADPAGVSAEYGHMTSTCCFCGADLSDDRSIEVGYGPVCAISFSLPWGTKVAKAELATA